jgi:hypothetical protein
MSVVLPGTSTYNLTALGTADWAEYNAATPVRKNGGGGQISVSHVGTFTDNVATDSKITATWSDGTPTVSGSSTNLIYSASGVGIGYSAVFPADTQQRKVTVICGNYNANVRITATLSDGSAAQAIDNSLTGSSTTGKQAVATIVYRAAAAGQTLTVTVLSTSQGSSSNTSFEAATLSLPSPVLSADPGAFSLAGNTAALQLRRVMLAQSGAFTSSGNPAVFSVIRKLVVTAGAFVLSGSAVALTYQPKPSPTGPTYTLTAAAGSFVLTGRSAGLTVWRRFLTATGAFASVGKAALFKVTRKLAVVPGAFLLQGNATVLTYRGPNTAIDATKVPSSRTVVFGGSIRVVNFGGSKRMVSF